MTKAYSKISGYDRPHVYVFVSDKKISTLESVFKNFRIRPENTLDTVEVKAGCFRYCCNTLKTGTPVFMYKNPITDFTELLERVKKAVPVLKGTPEDQIRISYKDVQLGTFLNIDSHEQLHLQETFRNAFPCGSDSYRRVHLKVRESDSPFLLKSSRS